MEYLRSTQTVKVVSDTVICNYVRCYFSLCLFCGGCGRERRWIKIYLLLWSQHFCLAETSCLSSLEQEDPRLRIPVQQRRRGSLDPNDLGPLPVRLLIVLSLPCFLSAPHRFSFKNSARAMSNVLCICLFKNIDTYCLTQSELTVLRYVVEVYSIMSFLLAWLGGEDPQRWEDFLY